MKLPWLPTVTRLLVGFADFAGVHNVDKVKQGDISIPRAVCCFSLLSAPSRSGRNARSGEQVLAVTRPLTWIDISLLFCSLPPDDETS
jgi:hypothetical protein